MGLVRVSQCRCSWTCLLRSSPQLPKLSGQLPKPTRFCAWVGMEIRIWLVERRIFKCNPARKPKVGEQQIKSLLISEVLHLHAPAENQAWERRVYPRVFILTRPHLDRVQASLLSPRDGGSRILQQGWESRLPKAKTERASFTFSSNNSDVWIPKVFQKQSAQAWPLDRTAAPWSPFQGKPGDSRPWNVGWGEKFPGLEIVSGFLRKQFNEAFLFLHMVYLKKGLFGNCSTFFYVPLKARHVLSSIKS